MENLFFDGPEEKFHPLDGTALLGDNPPLLSTGVNDAPQITLPALIDKLNALKDYVNSIIQRVDSNLSSFILPITSNQKLQDAHTSAWPSDQLGTPPNYVSYNYYKALGSVDTAASHFIQNTFQKSMRDVGGDSGLDYITILTMMSNEVDLVKGFIDQYVGNVDDSSEHRTIELFDIWASNAKSHAQTIDGYLADPSSTVQSLPDDEVTALAPDEAQQSQAVFKVKLNSLSGEIASGLDSLQKIFAQYADLFYNKFLGPAIKFRLDVSRKVYPKKSTIGLEVWNSTSALNVNVTVSIADQLRRVQFFDSKLTEIEHLILMRDTYKGYITQVAGAAGNTATSSLIQAPSTESPDIVTGLQSFAATSQTQTAQTNSFVSPHNMLDGRDDPNAHPQYVLQGATIPATSIEGLSDLLSKGVSARTIDFSRPGPASVIVGTARWYATGGDFTITQGVRLTAGTAPSGGQQLVIDIKKDGVSIFTTTSLPTLTAGEFSIVSMLPDVTTIKEGEYITLDIVVAAGSDIIVQIPIISS